MKLENYFRVSVFGTDLVRKVASVLSICIIAGYHSFNANALNFKQNAKNPGIFLSRDLKILTM